ncbi:Hint domain-containing protein, partial [Streptomyces sp. NPDC091263]|uniref:Hint domain-containing protein n=2 Tax=unclassified Streptomyces TaxID=2593676 RepID=UPI00344E0B1D
KSRKKVKEAEEALEKAGKKVDGEKKSPPKKDKPEKPNCPVKHSFLPGTQVLFADGRTVSIEAVRVGDLVEATDPDSGLTQARRVDQAITTYDDKDFTRLVFRTRGGPAVITATDTHPFWVSGERRWADAGDITPGMKLRTPDGSVLAVAAVSRYTQHRTTHDLTVNGIHTYYVVAGGTPVLVHNDDPCEMVSKPNALSQKTGYTVKQIKEAIHKVKAQGGWRGNGANRNPDMLIDPKTGEVYPQMPDGSPGDSIGNIFDHLPEEP